MTAPYNESDSASFYRDAYAGRGQIGHGFDVFAGRPVMGGDGIGSALSGLARIAMPMLKRGAINLGKRVLNAGANVAGDIIRGDNIKGSLKRRFAATGQDLLGDVVGAFAPDTLKGPKKRRKAPAPRRPRPRRNTPARRRAGRRILI